MSDEYFYAATLSASQQTSVWDPEAKDYPRSNKLHIRQAVLGPEAKADELNVVQVEAPLLHEKSIKVPIAVLKADHTWQTRIDLEFPDAPVTFKLIQGSGPVHIMGQHLLGGLVEEFEDMEEMEEEMIDDEEGDDSQFKEEDEEDGEPKGKKPKISNNSKGKATSPKKNAKK